MNTKDRDTIIDDLLKKRPSGPDGVYIECTEISKYCYDRRRYVNQIEPSIKHFGYTPETLFKLGLKDRSRAEQYIRSRFFEGKGNYELGNQKSTVTRRTNRLWTRIEDGVSQIRANGSRGIYVVKCRWDRNGDYGAVYALNKKEALETAKMSFGYLMPTRSGNTQPEIHVEFVSLEDSKKLTCYNASIVDKVNDRITQYKQEIVSAERTIKSLEARLTTISLVEAQMLDLGDE